MARRPRLDLPGIPQHVIQRGNNRSVCFHDEADYVAYLQFLELASKKAECAVHAYVLMTNHVHLLVTGKRERSLAVMMQSLGRRYVRHINEQYRRTGSLWEGRYRSTLIDSDRYLLTCYRYIELNPVRAAIVANPGDYAWSSYLHHANCQNDPLISDHEIFLSIAENEELRAIRYRELCSRKIDQDEIKRIRNYTNRGYVLGSSEFAKQIEAALQRRVLPGQPGRPKSSGS